MNTPSSSQATLIEKIRKLRALSESDNLHEAAAAASAAERLIQEHNLSEAALNIGGEDEEVGYDGVVDLGTTIPTWQANLCFYLARAYQCSGYYKKVWRPGYVTINRYVAYGRPSDLATLRYQFAFFTSEITRLCERHSRGRGRTYANNFRIGAVSAIGEALDAMRTVTRQAATSNALVVVDRRAELAKAKKEADHPDLKTRSSGGSRYDADAYAAGRRAGANINQRAQIVASGTRLLGGKS